MALPVRMRCALSLSTVGWLLGSACLGSGCRKSDGGAASQAADAEQVVLAGHFQAVAKPASGSVQIIRRGTSYELVLNRVSLKTPHPAHVYLVGSPSARTTHDVDAAEMKYDLGVLQNDQAEQRIALPSEPDPALRSVVLWDPRYAANLASAALTDKSPEVL
jgi:hypothetical protein